MKTKTMFCSIVLLFFVFMGSVFGGTEGSINTFYGTGAGTSTTEDNDWVTFIGANAGHSNTSGYQNVFIGNDAGYLNTTGIENNFIGAGAGYSNTTGSYNTFIGDGTGYYNTIGLVNTFIGNFAGWKNTTGSYNNFLGDSAGMSNTTGGYNTFLGIYAGRNNIVGSGNVFLGYDAGRNETGSNRLYIHNSSTSTPLIYGEFDNRVLTIYGNLEVIGPYNGLVYLSDNTTNNTTKVSRMVLNHYLNAQLPLYLFGAASTATENYVAFGGGADIGNAATQIDLFTAENTTTPVGAPRLTIIGNGYVGIGTQSPFYPLEMASGAYVSTGGVWIDASSREYKDNIKGLKVEDAIETLQGLNPVTFSYKVSPEENHVGFVAEEVPDLVSMKDRKGLSPMDVVAVLTKVVQEQQKTISVLSEKVSELEGALQQRGTLAAVSDFPQDNIR